ncbi:MAG: hypothetical protein K0U98_24960 [Deltaproteobacteria bacterium]|nr:hypothetical protein [Deltaproteobacteria bacterium]
MRVPTFKPRSLIHLTAVAAGTLWFSACDWRHIIIEFPQSEPPSFNQRIRPDRLPLDPALQQPGSQPFVGPYRNGDPGSELVSEIFPELDGQEEKLLQSSCYWISSPAASTGDLVRLSWEGVVTLHQEQMHLTCESPTQTGLCRYRHPVDGRQLEHAPLNQDAPVCPGASGPPANAVDLSSLSDLPFHVDGTLVGGDEAWLIPSPAEDHFLHFFTLEERANSDPNPHRLCPGDPENPVPFTGPASPPRIFEGAGGRCRPDSETGLYQTCADRCTASPPEDASYRLSYPGELSEHYLQPNLMTVRGTSTLTRPLTTRSDGSLFWQTPTNTGEVTDRWHENFSPRIRVEQVRLYQVDGGVEKPIPLAPGLGLQVTGRPSQGPLQIWVCQGQSESDGVYFQLFPAGSCNDQDLLVTPTYAHAHLENSTGPLTQPLTWQVQPLDAPTGEVFVEFTIVGQSRSMALSITSPQDFGKVAIGESKELTATVENIGGEVAVIDNVFLGGAEAADFTFVLPGAVKSIPIPLEGEISSAGLGFSLTQAAGTTPPLLAATVDVAGSSLQLELNPEYEGTTQMVNGYAVEFENGRAFYQDPAADFASQPTLPGFFRMTVPAFARRSPPFQLLPGESFEAVVTGSPGGYGDRWGELHVEAHQLTDPSVRENFYASLVMDGVVSPHLNVVPGNLFFPTGSPTQRSWERSLLVLNETTFGITRSFQVTGPDAALFEVVSPNPTFLSLEQGDAEIFRIRFLLPCAPPIPATQPRAQLSIAADYGTEVVELTGFLPPDCVAP